MRVQRAVRFKDGEWRLGGRAHIIREVREAHLEIFR